MLWLLLGLGVIGYFLVPSSISLQGATVSQLPGGAGVVQTLGIMRALVNQAIADPLIRRYAVYATEGIERGDRVRAAIAIGEWVRRNVKYVPDPRGVEHLTDPRVFVRAIREGRTVYGDCDDMSMLVAAMVKAIGIRPVLHAVGRKGRYHHVMVEVAGRQIDPTVALGTPRFSASLGLTLAV